MLLTTAYQQAFWECKDNGNNRIKNNTMSYCRNKHVLFPLNKKATNSGQRIFLVGKLSFKRIA